jgi:hypothetical protein
MPHSTWKAFYAAPINKELGNKNTSVYTKAWSPDKNDNKRFQNLISDQDNVLLAMDSDSKGRVHDEDKGNIRPSLTLAREEEDYGSQYCGALHVCARLACVWHVGNDINLLAHCTHNTLVSFQVRWQR